MERVPPRPYQAARGTQGACVSEPEYAATGHSLGAVVYFSSASQNTARFIANCRLQDEGIDVYRIPLLPKDPALEVHEPYIIVVPTYGGGNAGKAVPVQVKKFLNNPSNRSYARGVIAAGNMNFGEAFCAAGKIIAAKCKIPFMYYFELLGTKEDIQKVREGVVQYFTNTQDATASTTATGSTAESAMTAVTKGN